MAAIAGPSGAGAPGEAVSRATKTAHAHRLLARAMIALLLLPLRFYRRAISPMLGARCRYYPSCSAYAEQAISDLGPLRGTLVAAWRVLRCNPFSDGGIDPLSERRLFRSFSDRSADLPPDGEEVPSR